MQMGVFRRLGSMLKHKPHLRVLDILKRPWRRIDYFVGMAGLLFGLIFLVVIPPMQGADESNHFLRAYQIAEGNIISDYVGPSKGGISTRMLSYDQSVGGNLPAGVVDFTQAGFGDLPQNIQNKMSVDKFTHLARFKVGSERKDASFGNTAAYSPIAYMPHVVGIMVGRVVSDRPIVTFYLARLMGLIAGLVLLVLAIRLMPFGKLPFAIIALLPMTIAQLPVVTADTLAVGFAFVAIALTLRFAYRQADMTRRDIAQLISVFAVLGWVKPSLAVISLILLVLLRNTHLARRKAVAIIAACVLMTALCAIGWNVLVKDLVIYGYQQAYPASNYAAQLAFIVDQPLAYAHTLTGTFLGHYLDYAVFSFIGILGWADTSLPMLAVVLGFINIAFAFYAASQFEKVSVPIKIRALALVIFGLVFCVTATFMYLFCNSVGDNYITGLQGRYLIPVAPILILLVMLGNKKIQNKTYAAFAKRTLYVSVLLLFIMVWVTVTRFYLA